MTEEDSAGGILARIAADKRAEILRRQKQTTASAIRKKAKAQPPPKDFAFALRDSSRLPVIAEIKRKSPSKGTLRSPFSPQKLARAFAAGGAACISVLTDKKYFGGESAHLPQAARAGLPLLRKDFVLCEWQVWESRALGADAVLLIAALLDLPQLQKLAAAAADWGMAALIETHDENEVGAALAVPDAIVGINNRDLQTFAVDIQTTARLAPKIKKADASRLVVAESGIANAKDAAMLRAAGADAFLIGETLMRAPAPDETLREFFPAE